MLSAAPRVDIGRETLSYQCSPGSRIESWPALFSIRWDLPPNYPLLQLKSLYTSNSNLEHPPKVG